MTLHDWAVACSTSMQDAFAAAQQAVAGTASVTACTTSTEMQQALAKHAACTHSLEAAAR